MIFIVDVETTGTDCAVDRVVEFAAVPVHVRAGCDASLPGALVDIGVGASSLVYPGIAIPAVASAVHHIVDEDVESAMPLGRAVNHVLGPFWEAASDLIFVAHSAPFDKSFLPMLQSYVWIDTLRCARHVWPDAPRYGNQVLRYWLGIKLPRDSATHRALFDATVTAHIFARLLEQRSLDDLVKLSRKAVVLRTINFGKYRGQEWTAVPTDYLEWLQDQKSDDPDVRFTVNVELKRRRETLKERGLV